MIGINQQNAFLSAELFEKRTLMSEITPSLTSETISIVGKSHKGTAFVPQQFFSLNASEENINTYIGELGTPLDNIDNQGYLGGLTWLENGGEQVSFCRILGKGSSSGFFVGNNIISGSSIPGTKASNPFSKEGGVKGKTCFFGKILRPASSINLKAS